MWIFIDLSIYLNIEENQNNDITQNDDQELETQKEFLIICIMLFQMSSSVLKRSIERWELMK